MAEFDPTATHPVYDGFAPTWRLMRDATEGEDAVKQRGETYLPMKSGTRAIADETLKKAAYEAYKLRAEFPEIVAPTIRGAVGTMLDQAASIELPPQLEPMREKATRDGLTLNGLHRRIAIEVMDTGRYGLLPGISEQGAPYLAGYVAEAITNWDAPEGDLDWLMLDESASVLDRDSGKWEAQSRFRECYLENGRYLSRLWVQSGSGWSAEDPQEAKQAPRGGRSAGLNMIPFVFIDTNDLTPEPDDVPLYGLARLAVRCYRLDADYTFALHMTSEPTPVAIGFDDAKEAINQGQAPTTLGSSKLWLLPKGGDAKYLEFSGPGLEQQAKAIDAALQRAVVFGAQIFGDNRRMAESGEALRLRLGNQQSTLKTIAMTSAAGLEKALKNVAVWVGADPEKVKVEPNLDFVDHELSAQEIMAIVAGWQAGAYSKMTMFDRFKRGELIPAERAFEEEEELIAAEGAGLGSGTE